ncbi:MAG: DUF481 domain-containing protein [bacterium]
MARLRFLVACLAPLLTHTALAQAPASPPKPPYEFVADFSLAASQGNQQVTTISLGEKYSYAFPHWKLAQTGSVLRGTANGVMNAELYQAGVRADIDVSKGMKFYSQLGALRNTPSGIKSELQEGLGLSFQVLTEPADILQLSGGVGALQRTFVGDSTTKSDFVGNVDGTYRHLFSKTSYFEQTAAYTPNFTTTEAWLLKAQSSLVAPLSSKIGIKVSYLINFNNAPPLLPQVGTTPQTEHFKKFDSLLTTGLQFTY